ncbi:hypothetical protein FQZ97_1265370 [compost metagenome]
MMPNHVAWAAGNFLSTGFWMITLTAASAAARRQSSTPATSAVERCPELSAITATPVNAIRLPMISQRGKPSLSRSPAITATRMGLTLISRAAVPASSRCSAALRATL